MGQRLVISVRHLGENVACLYYHWSAYTISALEEARKVWDCICEKDDLSVQDLQLRLIRMVEGSGGGIEGGEGSTEFARIQSMFPDETFKIRDISRNDGLIAISEVGMNRMLDWAEGTVTVDMDEGMIENDVFFLSDLDEYREDNELSDVSLEDIPGIDEDITFFPVDRLDYVIDALNHLNGFAFRYGEDIFGLIS